MILSKWFSSTRLETRTKESNNYASSRVFKPVMRNESKASTCTGEVGILLYSLRHYRPILTCERFECEHSCWDPKDGDLCLNRVKPGEILVEARSDTDVQIVRLIWV
jgi:hypothetical protein